MNIKRKTWIKRSAISIAVTSALLSHTVIAEENQDVDTTTIIGESASLLDVTINQDTLEKSQANDLKGIFKNEASVSVGGSSSVSQKIYVRDLESNMLNVTIDGAKQSASIFHHQGSISIEPELLKKVEVQAGAGSALTGPGALGGSLRFTTKDPDDLLEPGDRFGALIKGSYGSNANTYKTSLSLYGALTDNWSAMATIVQTEADDYEDGDGNEVEYTDYNQQTGLIKVVGNFENNQRLSLSFDNRIDDGKKLLKSNWTEAGKNIGIKQEAERQTTKIEYSIDPEDNQWLALKANVYNTENDLYRPLYDDSGTVETYGLDIRNTNKFSEHSLTYGVDYHNDKSDYSEGSSATRTDEGDVYGVYLQAEFQLAQSWLLNIGGRYDIYKTADADGQNFENKGFSPNISVQFKASDDLKFELGYAQAMRGVEVRETFLIYDGGYTNSSDLKEETASNIEFSMDYQLNKNINLSAKAYHSTIDDVITYGEYGDSNYKTFQNDDELVTKGASLSVSYTWQALQASVSYSHSTSKLNGEPLGDYYDTDLGNSTGDTINTSLNYQLSDSLELGWNAQFVTHLSDVADGFEEKVGYGVHDIYGQWLPLNDDSLRVTLSISNLFNKQYLDQSTFGVSEFDDYGDLAQGRDFKIAVAWAL